MKQNGIMSGRYPKNLKSSILKKYGLRYFFGTLWLNQRKYQEKEKFIWHYFRASSQRGKNRLLV